MRSINEITEAMKASGIEKPVIQQQGKRRDVSAVLHGKRRGVSAVQRWLRIAYYNDYHG